MLRTNNKTVKAKLIVNVLDNFWPKNYGGGTVGLQNLVDQIDSMRHEGRSIYDDQVQAVILYESNKDGTAYEFARKSRAIDRQDVVNQTKQL